MAGGAVQLCTSRPCLAWQIVRTSPVLTAAHTTVLGSPYWLVAVWPELATWLPQQKLIGLPVIIGRIMARLMPEVGAHVHGRSLMGYYYNNGYNNS